MHMSIAGIYKLYGQTYLNHPLGSNMDYRFSDYFISKRLFYQIQNLCTFKKCVNIVTSIVFLHKKFKKKK